MAPQRKRLWVFLPEYTYTETIIHMQITALCMADMDQLYISWPFAIFIEITLTK